MATVRRVYRRMALQLHPDRDGMHDKEGATAVLRSSLARALELVEADAAWNVYVRTIGDESEYVPGESLLFSATKTSAETLLEQREAQDVTRRSRRDDSSQGCDDDKEGDIEEEEEEGTRRTQQQQRTTDRTNEREKKKTRAASRPPRYSIDRASYSAALLLEEEEEERSRWSGERAALRRRETTSVQAWARAVKKTLVSRVRLTWT